MKYFFFSIFLIIVAGLVFFYIQISNFNLNNNETPFTIHKEKQEKNSIIKALSLNKNRILLPAKELYLKIDFHNGFGSNPSVLYRTLLNNLNEYTLFGVEQILKLNNIKYSIIKSKNDLKLFINFNRKSQADKIINLFKKYNFDVKLQKINLKE
jgi:hypothetical protein